MENQLNSQFLNLKIAGCSLNFLFVICVVFLMGSTVHVHFSSISGTNIITFLLFPFILCSFFTEKHTAAAWFAFLGFGLLCLFSLFAVSLEAHPDNLRLLRGALVSSAAVWGAAWVVKHHPQIVPKVVYCTLLICALIGTLQISYLVTGIGLDPAASFGKEDFYAESESLMGVPSIFGNPNNFSVFATLVFLYFRSSGKSLVSVPIVLSLFCILISGSKTALIIAVVGLLIGRRLNIKGLVLFILLFLFLAFYLLAVGFEGSGIYAIDRTLFAISEILLGSLDHQSSASIRFETWVYFLREYSAFMFGAFEAGIVFPQFLHAPFDASLIAINPHSFIIELHALFGFGGLIISIALFLSIYKSLSRFYSGWLFVYVLGSILLLVNVPSSILGSGTTFALITLLGLTPVPGSSFSNPSQYHHYPSSFA